MTIMVIHCALVAMVTTDNDALQCDGANRSPILVSPLMPPMYRNLIAIVTIESPLSPLWPMVPFLMAILRIKLYYHHT